MTNKSLAIACASGSFKGAFAHGVLSALEANGIFANAYAAASSSVIPVAWAVLKKASELGVDYWLAGLQALGQPDMEISQVVKGGINNFSPPKEELFAPETPAYFVVTSAVITPEATKETQGEKFRRLGRRLLVSAAKKDRSWVDENLQMKMFSNKPKDILLQNQNLVTEKIDNSDVDPRGVSKLNENNFEEVAYATSRMLHDWEIPAWIDGKPYIDASYTCLCPAIEMVEAGYKKVIAIANEPGTLYRDMFQLEEIPGNYRGVDIHIIKPDVDPKEFGVDFTDATPEGLSALYKHGQEICERMLAEDMNFTAI
ncbi:MAG: hypothetical protein AAFX80_12610 [Cyanobacteria bacterium J06639_18]